MNLYVSNLSWDAEEENVQALFETIGEIKSIKIIKDRETGKPRGFCFVEMDNGRQAIEALNGAEILGRKIMVSEARPRGENRTAHREDNYNETKDNYKNYRR